MKININGIEFGNTGNFALTPPVKGLETPSIRTAEGDLSGRDGGYISAQFYGKRNITIVGSIIGRDCDEHEANRLAFEQAIPIRTLLPIFITLPSGSVYLAEGYVIDYASDFDSHNVSDFKLEILCPTPYLYDGGDGVDPDSGWVEQTINRIVSGGYVTPYSLPVQWNPGSSPSVVLNGGNTLVLPQIILEGTFTNPVITNTTNGAVFKLNMTTAPGDRIVIDMDKRTVTLNGGSVLPSVDPISTWWWLEVGNNIIRLDTDSGFDDNTGTIRYRAMFGGI